MEKEVKMATLVDEDGVEYELEVVKEFNYKDKKYAVLYESDCQCEDEDSEDDDMEEEEIDEVDEDIEDEDFDDEEDEDDEDFDDEDEDEDEDEECDGECDEHCSCHGSHDDDECGGHIYVLEVTTDENGKEVYNEVNENLMEELIPVVEKELYPTEE